MSQTGSPVSDGTVGPALAPAFAAWGALPSLAPALTAADGVHLVIDPGDGRVLHASAAAAPLAAALAAADAAALARQIAPSAVGEVGPRLVRLRLDPRRIAPPALCLLARGARADGAPVVLLVPTAPVSLPRPRPRARPAAEDPPAPAVAPGPPQPALEAGDRFVWRSDGAGMLVALTGLAGLAGLVGRDWPSLVRAGSSGDADDLRAALSERRTFRAAPAVLDLGGGPVAVDLSGAPLGRSDAAFSGFGGFGVIRRPPADTVPETAPAVGSAAGADALPAAAHDDAPPPAAEPPHLPPADPADRTASPVRAVEAHPRGWQDPATAEGGSTAGPDRAPAGAPAAGTIPAPAPAAADLSTDEHAAFREIARALGARYAGDDEPEAADPASPRPPGGAVMPFPGPQAEPPPGAAPAAAASGGESGLLAGLPMPALVLRGEAILAANPPFLDLTGFADLAALKDAGIGRLFRGLPPGGADASAARTTAVETADGRTRPVEVTRGACTWEGEPAACLILRPLAEEDTAPALAAERLAREVQAARATGAEAALDAIEAGVVTVDAAGRIVTLNRAAAGLFGCDPREVVGASFVGLFDARSALSVTEALRGAKDTPRAAFASGRSLTLDLGPARADGRRVAVLSAPQAVEPVATGGAPLPTAPPERPPPDGQDREAFLRRLDLSVRRPTAGIIELTDAMLREPFGTLGDVRYRHCLAEIRASGERMLERVSELLDIAAVEAGTLDLDPRPIALNEVVAACVARLQQEAARGRIVLRTSFSTEVDELEADERSVSRAACLVIEQAIRRSAAGGQVIVSTGAADSAQIAVRVRDTGAAGRDAGRIQDPGDDLALPRALVEANGGRLSLARRGDEDGTLVEIILPRRRAAIA